MQFQLLIADFIFLIHFLIVIYVATGILLIPFAYKMNWGIFKNKKLRILHLFLIILVSCESILGLTCPLTSLENYLRNILNTETFVSFWVRKIIYWDLPNIFFISLYCSSSILTIFWWKFFPPKTNKWWIIENTNKITLPSYLTHIQTKL